MRAPIKEFLFSGDLSLWPRRAPAFSAQMWSGWRQESRELLLMAKPFIETDQPLGTLHMDCGISDERVAFSVLDISGNNPNPCIAGVKFDHSEISERFPEYFRSRFSSNDRNRMELHDRITKAVVSKFNDQKISFEYEHRAVMGFRTLTAYWFDLLDTRHGVNQAHAFGERRGLSGLRDGPS